MDLVQNIAFAFNYSAKRMLCFKKQLAGDQASKQEMEKRTKISLSMQRVGLPGLTIYSPLNELTTRHGDTKAASYRSGILSFDFIDSLVAVDYILSDVVPLSKMLQKEKCDLVQASL
ncbi:hypothetical protein MAR_030466 [Mya arenaria]|uniref:Uncharacterized protein n=1 Tax=Mya arenaria TaxID=6604 RepID=A0ABY7F2N1_MYAAR|nr:hypothetical protein MAR_030466 [Mya arenaria]